MKTWLNTIVLGFCVLAAQGCSGPGRQFGAHAGAAGTSATDGGGDGKAGEGSGRSGAGGESNGGGAAGDMGDTAGAAGEASSVACGSLQCAPEATCAGEGADAHCVCGSGYTDPRGDGTLCQDIDECTDQNGGCDSLVTCNNTPGSFNCGGCPSGYTGSPSTGCMDIDECKTNNGGCDKIVMCTNTPGSRACGNCPFGYTGTGESGCMDIDECKTNNGDCDKTVTCNNTPGGHTCGNCGPGYTGGGASGCMDIDECRTNNGGCDALVKCTNTPGSFSCGACPTGYTGTGATGCIETNECATNNGGCSANATCSNTPAGSYTCACKMGYEGNGVTCSDVNECMTSNGGCSANATCNNTTGSYSCSCNKGYDGNGKTCSDVNECMTNNGGCSTNANCNNTNGSFNCVCKSGFCGDGLTCNAPGTGCKWNGTGPTCAAVALDNDSDGHGTTACTAAPGDDCDDTQDTVYTGATELCDGIDNDCDKKIDMADGLTLVGASRTMTGLNHGWPAAVSNDGSFGVIGNSSTISGLIFGTISSSGSGSVSQSSVLPTDGSSVWLDPHMAWSAAVGNYGIAYQMNGKGGLGGYAGQMAFTSCCWNDVTPSIGRGDVTARANDLLFVGMTFGNLGFRTLPPSGSGSPLTANMAISGSWDSYVPLVASTGTTSGVIWQLSSPKQLNWATLSASLGFGTTETLATNALFADIEAITAGYGIAWIEGVGFRFMIKRANGTTQCTSSVVPFGTVPSNQKLSVSDSANGNIVVATSPDSNLIRLYRFDNACKLMDDTDVAAASAPTEPHAVKGGSHVVVYWSDSQGGRYRFLSDQLCH